MSALEDLRALILGVHGRITSVDPDSAALRKDLNVALALVDELLKARTPLRTRPEAPWSFAQGDFDDIQHYLGHACSLSSIQQGPVLDFVRSAIQEITKLRTDVEIARRVEQGRATVASFPAPPPSVSEILKALLEIECSINLERARSLARHAIKLLNMQARARREAPPPPSSYAELGRMVTEAFQAGRATAIGEQFTAPVPEAPSQKAWLDIAEMAFALSGRHSNLPGNAYIEKRLAIRLAECVASASRRKAAGEKLERLEP